MASETDICNRALYMLGHTLVASLSENSEAARLCNMAYAPVRDALLRGYPWNFAMARAACAATVATPVWGYDHQYQLPSDCLAVRKVKEHEEDDEDWKVEGRLILTDADTCNILYTQRITDVNSMDPLFREALSAKIAAEIAYPLTNSRDMQTQMDSLYRAKLREARGQDSQEGSPDAVLEDDWLNARL